MTTPRLGLDELVASQSQPHVLINSTSRRLDVLVQLSVVSISNTPPGSPTNGVAYIVGSAPTGIFDGHTDDIAYYSNGWLFVTPLNGWKAWVQSAEADYIYNEGWEEYSAPGGGGSGGGSAPTAADFGVFFPGTPGSSQLLAKFIAPREFTFAANFTGSYGHIGTNPTSSFVMDVTVEGSQVGTITVNTSGVFSFATTGGAPVDVSAGERVEIVAPASVDGTAADIGFTLAASLNE